MKRYILFIATLLFVHICNAQSNHPINWQVIDLGTKSTHFTITNTQDTKERVNNCNGGANDVVYKFTTTARMHMEINTCNSRLDGVNVYLHDWEGRIIDQSSSNEGVCTNKYHGYINLNYGLPVGTYYVTCEGWNNTNGEITTTIKGTIVSGDGSVSTDGNTEATAFNLGSKASGFFYSDTRNTINYTNDRKSNVGNDVFYKFTINVPMDITISHAGSEVSDTYLTLLEQGTHAAWEYAYNDNSWDTGASLNPYQAFIRVYGLKPGTYYVVSEGKTQNGNITTSIKGTLSTVGKGDTMANPIDIGSKHSNFIFRDTQELVYYTREYSQCDHLLIEGDDGANEDMFYKFTTTKPMDITISHKELGDYSYIHLLDLQGKCIAHHTVYAKGPEDPVLLVESLAAGTYYVVTQGYYSCGYISTIIEGTVSSGIRADSGQNYILTTTPTKAISDITDLHSSEKLQTIQYYDGLGRPIQTIQVKSGNVRNLASDLPSIEENEKLTVNLDDVYTDLVSLQEYDSFGRESNIWLPAIISGNNGAYVAPSRVKEAAVSSNGNDQKPYSLPVYENSPLNRVLEQYGPGADWHNNGRSVKTFMMTNKGGSQTTPTSLVMDDNNTLSGVYPSCGTISLKPGFHFKSDSEKSLHLYADPSLCQAPMAISALSASVPSLRDEFLICANYRIVNDVLKKQGDYRANELYVTLVTDEDNNQSLEFKDKLGQVVLTRQINNGEKYDTYYVYDDFNNLRYVLPPLAIDRLTGYADNNPVMMQLAYIYKYDHRNRCIWKKLPGCEPIYYVYDKADRLIFSQDGEQRTKTEWAFNKYDDFGRVILSGILPINETHETLRQSCSNIVVKEKYDKPSSWGYTWTVLTNYIPIDKGVLVANYYDNYDRMLSRHPVDVQNKLKYTAQSGYGEQYIHPDLKADSPKGLLTATRTRYFNESGVVAQELITTMYYDNRQRLIQTKSTNHMGGVDSEYLTYNFTGQPVKKMHVHTASGKATQTEYYTYEYDHAGRLLKTRHKLNTGAEVLLAENTYDELGRLITNKKNNLDALKTTYTYNVRGWTTSILNDKYFKQWIDYQRDVSGNLTGNYNGNISAVRYQYIKDVMGVRFSNYTYDNLSRLTVSTYGEGNSVTGRFSENFSYDKHGNISNLWRRGNATTGGSPVLDDVILTYNGNQLKKVTDISTATGVIGSMDFKDYTDRTIEYTYNKNGAMTQDLNKGITQIQYNSLNLPQLIEINSPNAEAKIKYTYSASGQKLRVDRAANLAREQSPITGKDAINAIIGQPVRDGFLGSLHITDYVGNKVYEQGNLRRILVDGGYIENNIYHFYLTDHLGNNRIVSKADGTALQRNMYYAFGAVTAQEVGGSVQPYKYNAKELDRKQNLDLYDYSARHYEPAIGRFTTVDPLAEKYYSISPYVYCANNPIKFIDPTGMWYETHEGWATSNELEIEAFMKGEPPTDIYDYTGTELIYRGDNKDGKKGIEIRLPESVIEAKSPERRIFRGVAIAFTPLVMDFQLVGAYSVEPAFTYILITAGPEKGKWIKVHNLTLPPGLHLSPRSDIAKEYGWGGLGGSVSASVTVYDYTNTSLRNFKSSAFLGSSSTIGWGAAIGLSYQQELSTSFDEYGGVLTGNRLKVGIGMGAFLGISFGKSITYELY